LPLFRIDDDEVDQDARDLHLLRRKRIPSRHPLDLHDDDAARAACRLCHGEHFAENRFLFHRHVAVLVAGRAAQECDVHRDRFEE
jgi:hypothetical protein